MGGLNLFMGEFLEFMSGLTKFMSGFPVFMSVSHLYKINTPIERYQWGEIIIYYYLMQLQFLHQF